MDGKPDEGGVRNEFHGQADAVVQARDVRGDLIVNVNLTGDRTARALASLLRAQVRAADATPYRLLTTSAPPLSLIYVEQRAESTDETSVARAEMSLAAVLGAARHVLITGEPGGGKSTLTQHLVGRVAAWWLEPQADLPFGRVLPVRVPAQMLAGVALSEAVVAACAAELGPYLDVLPPPDLLDHALPDAEWLIVVDGLDEILDAERREAVVRALSARIADPAFPHRLLVTSRPLPEGELDAFRAAGAAEFRLRLFTQGEIATFARRWFTTHGRGDGAPQAAGYLHAIERSGLQDLVRVPLLATISAMVYEHDGGGRLPSGRRGLYAEFLRYLLNVRQPRLRARQELERQLAPYNSSGERIAAWLFDGRKAMLTELAGAWITGDAPRLMDVALGWIERECPFQVSGIPDLRACVENLLLSTGLIVHGAGTMSFLHQSFAEYLASGEMAGGVGDFDAWVHLALDPSRRDLAMFAVGAWTEQASVQERDALIEHLIEGRAERLGDLAALDDLFFEEAQTFLAGEIVADGISCSAETSERVVVRLLDLARDSSVTTASGALSILRKLPGHPLVAEGLTALAGEDGLETWVRREAAKLRALRSPGTEVRADDLRLREHPAVGIGTALALAELGRPEDAAAILQVVAADRKIDRGWRSEASAGLWELGFRLGYREQARQAFGAVVRSDPFPDAEIVDRLAQLGDEEAAAAAWLRTVRWSRSLPHVLEALIDHGVEVMDTTVGWGPPTSEGRSFRKSLPADGSLVVHPDAGHWVSLDVTFEAALCLSQLEDAGGPSPAVEPGSVLHALRRWTRVAARVFRCLTRDEFYGPISDAPASVAVDLLLVCCDETNTRGRVQEAERRRLEAGISQLSKLAVSFPGSPAQAVALGTLVHLGERSQLMTDALSEPEDLPSKWIWSKITRHW